MNYNQGTVTNAELSSGVYTVNAQNKEEIDEMIQLQTAGNDANSVYYSGISYFPIGLGQVFTIQNQTVQHELIAIEVTHHSEVHGNYSCEFKAIPADVAAPHYTDVHVFAKAENQPAQVKDNNDPEGLGRIKVQFYGVSSNIVSEWIRMIQPHSGAGKGFYFIPEIGEEVLVGFEGNNVQNPYVMGTQYNGNESSGYSSPQNNIKVIQTRSGCKIVINDAEGSILTQDKAGSKVFQDGQGNITTDAIKNFTVNAENINFNASQSISTSAGVNITESAGIDKSTTVGAILNTSVGGDHMLNVTGKLVENITGNIESHTEQERHEVVTKDYKTHSIDENVLIKSSKEIQQHSGEKTKAN